MTTQKTRSISFKFVAPIALLLLSAAIPISAQESLLSLQPAIKLFDEVGEQPQAVEMFDLNGDSNLDIVVVQGVSNDINVFLNDGAGNFVLASNAPFTVGDFPSSVAFGDFNGDGLTDLASANAGSDDISILIGDGLGNFDNSLATIPVGVRPDDIQSADLNADGNADLIVVNLFDDSVSVLLGDGLGSFSNAEGSPMAVGDGPDALAVGKIDGDSHFDLAVANSRDDNISILLGDGSGGFTSAITSPIPAGERPRDVLLADLNGDAVMDLAVANNGGFSQGSVSVLLGDGAAGFDEAVGSPISTGSSTRSIALGDFDGDGNLDLTAVNTFSDTVSILLGDGTGEFSSSPQDPLSVFNIPSSVAVGDFDGDNNSDVVIAHSLANRLSLFAGDGAGTLSTSPASPIILGINPVDTALGDFDGDGRLDVAVAQFSQEDVLILLGRGGAEFAARGTTPPVGGSPNAIVTDDFNSDGKLDLATVNSSSNSVGVLLGDGDGGFSVAIGSPFSAGRLPQDVVSGDANSDGNPDLFVAGFFSDDVSIHLGDGTGAFTEASGSPIQLGGRTSAVEVSDFNSDGSLDIAVVNSELNTVHILIGDDNGNFLEAGNSPIAVGQNPRSIGIGDLNADSFSDLIVGNAQDGSISVLLGDGAGGFSSAPGSPFGGFSTSRSKTLRVSDVNNDDIPDILSVDQENESIVILIGDGSGSFSPASDSPIVLNSTPNAINLGDTDGDGQSDAFVVTDGPSTPDELLILLTSELLFSSSFVEPSVAE